MIDLILTLKLVHILGATVLFGTGIGIAFFMWMANRTRDAALIAQTARFVVVADTLFTATAVVIQPLTGFALIWLLEHSLGDTWIVISLILYVLVGLCWLPVVWIQIRLRDLAVEAARQNLPLPQRYDELYRVWFTLGWPAFVGVIAIFALMIWKPHW